jgi:osmoprotectant transport system permease protein
MSYIFEYPDIVWGLLLDHIRITGIGLFISVMLALPIGILITTYRWTAVPVMGTLGVLYTIPSLALIILLVPFFGLNATSVIIALTIYAQIILVRHVVAGLNSIDPAVIEAAYGMGMSWWRCWWTVQFPLALPIMLAGLRIAMVVTIGIATIGAKFGAGGLGKLLFDGIAQNNHDKIWAGSLALVVMAMVANVALQRLESLVHPDRRVRRAEQHRQYAMRGQGS